MAASVQCSDCATDSGTAGVLYVHMATSAIGHGYSAKCEYANGYFAKYGAKCHVIG